MSRRYDTKTTTFSPEGRLFQVEYAMEAISHAGTAFGIICSDGILLAAERKIASKLLDPRQPHEKIFPISRDIICVVAGISADANILIDHARVACQRYEYAYGGQPMPVEQLVQQLCDLKQSYTQHGGMRPFGVAFLIAGWDRIHGLQLYQSDPSGNYSGWRATCIGAGATAAQSILKSEYPESEQEKTFTTQVAGKLLVKVLEKTMEAKTLNGEKVEIAILKAPVCEGTDGTAQELLSFKEVDSFMAAIPKE